MIKSASIFILILLSIFQPLILFADGTSSGAINNHDPLAAEAGIGLVSLGKSSSLAAMTGNPAYIVTDKYSLGLGSEFLPMDMSYSALAFSGKAFFARDCSMGALIKYFTSGDIEQMDQAGEQQGTFNIHGLSLSGGLSKRLSSGLLIGTKVNIINESIIQDQAGFSFDAGLGYAVRIKEQKFDLGLALLNWGSTLWERSQAQGLGCGVMTSNQLFQSACLEYGIGFYYCDGLESAFGPGLRFSHKFRVKKSEYLDYQLGLSYSFNGQHQEFVQGLKWGISVHTSFRLKIGYEFISYPWGAGNKIFIGYTFI